MSATLYNAALDKVRTQLLASFPGSFVEAFPYDIDPHTLAESGINWPEDGKPLVTIFDGAIAQTAKRARAPQRKLAPVQQEGSAEVVVWFRASDSAGLVGMAAEVREARRTLFDAIETVAKLYPHGSDGEWGIDWARGDVKPTRLNTGFYVAIRAAIVVAFEE